MNGHTIKRVPFFVLVFLCLSLALQIYFSGRSQNRPSRFEQIENPPSFITLRLLSLAEANAIAKLAMLRIQTRDQASLDELDYSNLTAWLGRIIELDPRSNYALFSASELYAEVENPQKQRVMLEFIYHEFLKNPNQHWKAMTRACLLARHSLKDNDLAKKYARAIRLYATGAAVPSWAKQMEIFLLEDLNELAQTKIILSALLQSGEIKDQHERLFLEQKLATLERKMTEKK